MQTQKMIHKIIYPLVEAGIYENEEKAFADIVMDFINNKIRFYSLIITALKNKYGRSFEEFTGDIKNKADYEAEEDWMEWKGADEMHRAWKNTQTMLLKQIL